MPKRKRSVEETVEEQLKKFGQDLHHALKLAKGFERQRQAKRLKDPSAPAEKKDRIQKEIFVLKSLDLHQAAHAHLCASLLKIKSVAAAPNLPAELKAGPPKPDISEEERVALHNVTSALYNRKEVRTVLEKAVPAICATLGVDPPPKKGKGPAKDARKEKEGQPADREVGAAITEEERKKGTKEKEKKQVKEERPEDISDDEAEAAIAKYEALLGASSDEDSGTEGDDEEEDPMEITEDEGEDEDNGFGNIDLESGSEEIDGGSESSFDGFSDDDIEEVERKPSERGDEKPGTKSKVRQSVEDEQSEEEEEEEAEENEEGEDDDDDSDSSAAISRSPSPKRASKRRKAEDTGPTTGSTFLPSLMGGYISGSESASDVDLAPPRKNRRGQRARQAIWEKKYKAEARHLQKQTRDQGWDPKRGAVEGGGARTPWKKGISNPFSRPSGGGVGAKPEASAAPAPKKPRAPDNSGPLHPSWEAKKKAEEKQQNVTFQGKKIKFE